MKKTLKTIILSLALGVAAMEPIMAQKTNHEIIVLLLGGQKITGTPEWKDSSLRVRTEDNRIQEVGYREIQRIKFMSRLKRRKVVGTLIGPPVGATVAVVPTIAFANLEEWDLRPIAACAGGCCAGGLLGSFIGKTSAIKGTIDIIGDHGRFQKAREQWRQMTGT